MVEALRSLALGAAENCAEPIGSGSLVPPPLEPSRRMFLGQVVTNILRASQPGGYSRVIASTDQIDHASAQFHACA
jgi:hypothetical protein